MFDERATYYEGHNDVLRGGGGMRYEIQLGW